MNLNNETKLLRIFISSTDKFKHSPLYEVIVFAAKRYGLSGVTVLKDIMGYGASNSISSQKFWELSEKLPLVIEIVDSSAKIEKFARDTIPYFETIKKGCQITIEDVKVIYSYCF